MDLAIAHAQCSSCKRRQLFLALEAELVGVVRGSDNMMVEMVCSQMVLMTVVAMWQPSLVVPWASLPALESMHGRETGNFVSRSRKSLDVDYRRNRTVMDMLQAPEVRLQP